MYFDLQRFDETGYGPKWIWQDENVDGYQGETLWFIPAGKTYTIKREKRWWYGMQLEVNVPYPDDNATIIIEGNQYGAAALGSVPSPDTSTTVTASLRSGQAISDVVVTGSDRNLLRITIDGTEYTVGDDGHLKPPFTVEQTSGDVLRKIVTSENVDADTLRKIISSETLAANTLRKILAGETLDADTLRKIISSETINVDALRKILASEIISADTLRKIISSENVDADTLRKIISSETINGDTLRKILGGGNVSVDTLRKIISSETFDADTLAKIVTSESLDVDTFLQILCSEEVGFDTLLQIICNEHLISDTDREILGQLLATSLINRTKRANGKIVSREIRFVNPRATDEQLSAFIDAINSLSDNTKQGAIRVKKTAMD